jgi:hypothetical protein
MGCEALAATELGQRAGRRIALSTVVETLGGAAFDGVIIEALPSLTGVARVLLASMVGISVVLLVTGM